MEISRRIGIIFGLHSGIFPRSREKVNNGPLILTCKKICFAGWSLSSCSATEKIAVLVLFRCSSSLHMSHLSFGSSTKCHLQWVNQQNLAHIVWRRGGLVVNTLAYHTGDPGSIPGRGGSSEKCESIWGDFSSPACNPPSLIRGYTKGTGGDGRIICVRTVSCAVFSLGRFSVAGPRRYPFLPRRYHARRDAIWFYRDAIRLVHGICHIHCFHTLSVHPCTGRHIRSRGVNWLSGN